MVYSPIQCPSCGSRSIVPSENERIYCKNCDGLFEKNERQEPEIVAPIEFPPQPILDEKPTEFPEPFGVENTILTIAVIAFIVLMFGSLILYELC